LNTLILVHRRQLMDQWIERLTAFSSLPRDAIGIATQRYRRASGRDSPD
jgi:superfamily II DNA or RNA helicase